jgi:hypothetical protein
MPGRPPGFRLEGPAGLCARAHLTAIELGDSMHRRRHGSQPAERPGRRGFVDRQCRPYCASSWP